MTTDTTELAHMFASMLNTGNIALIDQFIASNYINHNPYVADGPEANKQFWQQWLAAFPDTVVTVEDAFSIGDKVAGRYTYRATHQGSFLGIAATGNTIIMRSIDIWRVENGMFAEHWDELNMLEVFQQLGVIPSIG